jgi:hypothetical protein
MKPIPTGKNPGLLANDLPDFIRSSYFVRKEAGQEAAGLPNSDLHPNSTQEGFKRL